MKDFEREELQQDLNRVLGELMSETVPTRYIMMAQLRFLDGTTTEVSGTQLEALLKEYLSNPESMQIVDLKAVIDVVKLKTEITERCENAFKGMK